MPLASPENHGLLTLAAVAKAMPHRPSTNAVFRWVRYGRTARDGSTVRLKAVRYGHANIVRPADLEAFFERLSREPAEAENVPETPSNPPSTTRRRQRVRLGRDADEAAMSNLKRDGWL